ncbi:hypothetical protein ACJX0J_015149 [Zea mays]
MNLIIAYAARKLIMKKQPSYRRLSTVLMLPSRFYFLPLQNVGGKQVFMLQVPLHYYCLFIALHIQCHIISTILKYQFRINYMLTLEGKQITPEGKKPNTLLDLGNQIPS